MEITIFSTLYLFGIACFAASWLARPRVQKMIVSCDAPVIIKSMPAAFGPQPLPITVLEIPAPRSSR